MARRRSFCESRENHGDSQQLIWFPGEALQRPQKPRARTAATKKGGVGGLHEGVDLRLRLLQILLEQAQKLFRRRFGIKRQVVLLGEQSFGCQRCQQPADEKIDLPPDTAKPLAEERIAMNSEEDQRFADTLAKRA